MRTPVAYERAVKQPLRRDDHGGLVAFGLKTRGS